jgi:hypothetical protein
MDSVLECLSPANRNEVPVTEEANRGLMRLLLGLIRKIEMQELPVVRPRRGVFSDAGPGVSTKQWDVRVREAELVLLFDLDWSVRLHRARYDPCEAERTNSALGDAIVTGETIPFEHHKKFAGLTKQEAAALTGIQVKDLEEKRFEKNCWSTAALVSSLYDGAPGPNKFEQLRSFVTPKTGLFPPCSVDPMREFFSNPTAPTSTDIPGAGYFNYLQSFIENHFIFAHKFMEYHRDGCIEDGSAPCIAHRGKEWVGPRISRLPSVHPDPARPGRFLGLFQTPLGRDKGATFPGVFNLGAHVRNQPAPRPVLPIRGPLYVYPPLPGPLNLHESLVPRQQDDFSPTLVIASAIKAGFKSSDTEDIKALSDWLHCKEDFVVRYFRHKEKTQAEAERRKRDTKTARVQKLAMTYDEYDWRRLEREGKLNDLLVAQLDCFLDHHDLVKTGRKPEKVQRVTTHILGGHSQAESSSDSEADDQLSESESSSAGSAE